MREKSLLFKIIGPELFAFQDEGMSKIRFLHALGQCSFELVIEEEGDRPICKKPMQRYKTHNVNDGITYAD